MAGVFETFQSLLGNFPPLRPFTESVLRSIGSTTSFNFLLLKSILTGQDCSLFKQINWAQCSKDQAFRDLGKKIVKQNEQIRSQNASTILELKQILSSHISPDAKLYFDEEDAKSFAQGLLDKSTSSAQVSESLMECSLLLDSVANNGLGKYQRQLSTLQSRIADLEHQLLVVNDKLRLNEKPESESRVAEEFEVVRNAGNVQTLSVSKNTTVATCEVKYSGISGNGRFLIVAGENHPILKIDTLEDKQSSSSSTLLNPVGFGIDNNDNVWVHNAVNHKLFKFDSFLNLLQTWDGHDIDFTQEGNTLGFNDDKSLVYWYKGNNECLVIDAASNQIADTIDYFIDDVPVVKGIFAVKDTTLVAIVTCNHSGEDAKLQVFDIKKHKLLQKTSYSKITDNVAFRIQNVSMIANKARMLLVGLSTGDSPKSVVSVISLPDMKLIDQLVTESTLPLFSAAAFSSDLLALAGPSSIHLGEFDPKSQQLKLVCRDVCALTGNFHTLVVSRDLNKFISTSNRGRLVCVSVKQA